MRVKSIKMKMPDLVTNEGAELQITRWLVEVGEPVRRGQPLLEVETDKSAMEIEAIVDGVLTEKLVTEGGTAFVGDPIAIIEAA